MIMDCDFTNFCMSFCVQVDSVTPRTATACSPWHRPLDPSPSKGGQDENDITTHASEKRRMRRRLKRGILRSRDIRWEVQTEGIFLVGGKGGKVCDWVCRVRGFGRKKRDRDNYVLIGIANGGLECVG
eukprot:CCRYP_005622-RA/>CCRYP_005622-RA protein AED:0.48 eAED:1.00 QI:0/0/0/1/1/1/2/0/127